MTYKQKIMITIAIVLPFVFISLIWGILTGMQYYKFADPSISKSKIELTRLANLEKDFKHFKINPNQVEYFENGRHISFDGNQFEQWKFEGKTKDKNISVFFSINSLSSINKKQQASVTIFIQNKGKTYLEQVFFNPKDCKISQEACDIKIGENSCKGNFNNFKIKAKTKTIKIALQMTNRSTPWRPGAGHLLFGKNYDNFIGFLVPIPNGKMTGIFTIGNEKIAFSGNGYHDHWWSTKPIDNFISNIWKATSQSEKSTIFAMALKTRKKYGEKRIPILMVADENKVLIDSSYSKSKTEFAEISKAPHPDKRNKREIAADIEYEYKDPKNQILLKIENKQMIKSTSLLDQCGVKPFRKKIFAGAKIFPWETTFTGKISQKLELEKKKIEIEYSMIQSKIEFR